MKKVLKRLPEKEFVNVERVSDDGGRELVLVEMAVSAGKLQALLSSLESWGSPIAKDLLTMFDNAMRRKS